MMKSKTELTYLRAAAQSATSVGLVIILYDLLIQDLEKAIAARNVEARAAEIKHSFLVLQQLEGSLDAENGGEAAKTLASFYAVLRCKILEGQIKASPEILREQIALVLDVREAWQQVDKPNLGLAQTPGGPIASIPNPGLSVPPSARQEEFVSSSWTA
jgi:flagellar protein FliS